MLLLLLLLLLWRLQLLCHMLVAGVLLSAALKPLALRLRFAGVGGLQGGIALLLCVPLAFLFTAAALFLLITTLPLLRLPLWQLLLLLCDLLARALLDTPSTSLAEPLCTCVGVTGPV